MNPEHMANMNSIRTRPRWQVARLLKAAQVTQWDIARRAGVSQSYVSHVLARNIRTGPKVAKVWRQIEAVAATRKESHP